MPNKYITLSHFLDENTFGYGGTKACELKQTRSIKNGNSSNNFNISISAHSGTHIDFPYHFDENGKKSDDYNIGDLIYNNIEIVELKNVDSSHIIENIEIKNDKCDLLLIKTGFEKYRQIDKYWQDNPIFSANCINTLRKNNKNLKAIGVDFISVGSIKHRQEGRAAHKAFLCDKKPILILEDMKLSSVSKNTNLKKVFVVPMPIKGVEAAPVNVFGEV